METKLFFEEILKIMTDKTKFTAFRCPTELFKELLESSKNKSEIIVNALKSYKSKEFRETLFSAFTQYSKLFHLIELHFKNGRTTLSQNELINFVEASITNAESIDSMESILK